MMLVIENEPCVVREGCFVPKRALVQSKLFHKTMVSQSPSFVSAVSCISKPIILN